MQHIPYEGGGPAMASVVAGETDFYGAPYSTAKPSSRAAKSRRGLSSKERSLLPDLPAASETVPGFEFMSFYGLVLPKGTPTEIRDKIRATLAETLADPDIKKKLQTSAPTRRRRPGGVRGLPCRGDRDSRRS